MRSAHSLANRAEPNGILIPPIDMLHPGGGIGRHLERWRRGCARSAGMGALLSKGQRVPRIARPAPSASALL